jgi:membrane protein implicated in regulation of membrane protease activity
MPITTNGWSGLAAPAVAAAAVHYTGPWYLIFGPVLVIAIRLAIGWRRRGGGRGPFNGS